MAAPEWFSKGSLPQWVFQATGLGLIVYLVITAGKGNLAIVLPVLLTLCGIEAFRRFAGRLPADRERHGEDET